MITKKFPATEDLTFFENQIAREWFSTKEASHYLGVSENALRIMVYRGQIPSYKFGRRLRFRSQDCMALFQKKGA
ncbi:helix-turn-helix domain-containing protein [bacterium]|nr:helix-turn-helix domain-containing protein [bacterium]